MKYYTIKPPVWAEMDDGDLVLSSPGGDYYVCKYGASFRLTGNHTSAGYSTIEKAKRIAEDLRYESLIQHLDEVQP
jgi:hypothetical protein